jgi:hypothetical protein
VSAPSRKNAAPDAEERARRAEAALEEALAERNRLWEELHTRASQEHELKHYKMAFHSLVHSKSWQITAPLRWVGWFARSIPDLARRLRRYIAARPRHQA